MTRIATATFLAALAVVAHTNSVYAQEVSVDSMPPSVVTTVPACGDTEVPATTKEIKVTFSKDMKTKLMWSWCMQSPGTFPEITDPKAIKYLDDKRTCVLPVKLTAGKTYVIWINSEKHNAFRDINGNPAIPYLLVFSTR